ncbi:FdhF/YdeP family oxidoreductase [Actinocrinis puniceicyclus]|uniref:FdhF/YdeP family oxidoreductase n=1 Tax=Actinocrinis puniceicyclus TaxID=977794 RepID=A0A8J8BFQ4_9ACTN|nr:FdhF/YdeP family oxidoreductase [Actinocrinis puniceicyclus]MBS2966895.1 FdhF/YdeP family oxidoreductase [Actinocrinis puniceicyclus]
MATAAPRNDPADENLSVGSAKTYAAGAPAVAKTMRLVEQQMGVKRTALTLLRVNQPGGFDCPGCAWPEGPDRGHLEFCENGAKAVAQEATLRRVTRAFFEEHTMADLAAKSDYWLGQQGRLTEPMYKARDDDRYRPVSWSEAFRITADALRACAPDEAVFYTSGRTSNEAAFLYQLLVRRYGTNNLPDCSNMCHESSGSALSETLGVGKGSVSLDDLYRAELIIVVGQNPGTNHPRMLVALERAKRAGARIVAVNPLPEAGLIRFKNPQTVRGLIGSGTPLADEFLQIRLGGDLALFRALGRLLLEAEERMPGQVLDRAFIDTYTHGFDAYAKEVRETPWETVLEATGLPREQVEALGERVLGAKSVIVCWAMGLTQHRHSVPTIREIVNFLLLRGNVGRPGAGVCPVRGHSNVQGDRTMGIYEKPPARFLDALEAEFGFEPPRAPGYDTVDAIRAMRDGKVRVFFAVGGNFVNATPDTAVTEAAMRNCALTVQVSTKLNRSHAVTGRDALILPTLGRTERDVQECGEQFVTVEDSMSMVHASRGRLEPASPQLRSEVSIIAGLARQLLGERVADGPEPVEWEWLAAHYDRIRDRIERVVPGFADFNARVREPQGFQLPHGPRDSRTFPTATGKANFTVNELDVLRVPEGHLLLQTIRSHDQYNTTIYGLDDRYRGIRQGRRVVFVNPADLVVLGCADGDLVDLVSVWRDGVERRAPGFRVVGYPTARGCAAAYFPETNVLVPLDSTAQVSNTPTSKSVVVRLVPATAAAAAARTAERTHSQGAPS